VRLLARAEIGTGTGTGTHVSLDAERIR